jgi:uncharacterized membrane protein
MKRCDSFEELAGKKVFMSVQSMLSGMPTVFGCILMFCGFTVAIIGVVTMYVAHSKDKPGIERSGDIAFRIGQVLVFLGGAFIAEMLAAAIPCFAFSVIASVRLLICLKEK